MMNTLYLVAEEQKLFIGISDGLKEGWSIELEDNVYEDTPEKFALRLDTYMPYDPVLRVLADELSDSLDLNSATAVCQNTDFSGLSDDALIDLFYTLGPDVLSALILKMLENISTDENVHEVAAFAFIRHSLLSALTKA